MRKKTSSPSDRSLSEPEKTQLFMTLNQDFKIKRNKSRIRKLKKKGQNSTKQTHHRNCKLPWRKMRKIKEIFLKFQRIRKQ